MDASDAIHDIHGLMALASGVSGHCAINLDEILSNLFIMIQLTKNPEQNIHHILQMPDASRDPSGTTQTGT